ncbi:Phototropic-responsive NPH3 family protein [Rhynchospora pubera]|uniref:Phototropic-responsive NPH3 family protein n=1 Tax=Rhynchospora pubera TaxID=906938 RepID=A0AAV8DJ35_9POAL|nr:Phototropic-responsive NPH3 family protein [Rhynchospora pubera]
MDRSFFHHHEEHQRHALVPVCSSSTPRHINWMLSDVPSDITIEIDGISLALHKFPLLSRCGRIRKLLAQHRNAENIKLELLNVPGCLDSFELAVKFCYGINFEITTTNVAQLCCISDYLEMSEEYSNENLSLRSESYLETVVCKSLEMHIEVLHQCENLLPLADELRIVGKCVDSIASKAYAEQVASSFSRLEYSSSGRLHMNKQVTCKGDWWIEDLSVLRIDMYQKVIEAIRCRGVRPESIGTSLVNYTDRLLKRKPSYISPTCEEKVVIETISALLPQEKCTLPVSFLFGLLRFAVMLDCNLSCKLNLERRIGAQLDMATLDDLLIPSSKSSGETLLDVDTVHRILVIFAQHDDSEDGELGYDYDSEGSIDPPSQSALVKVAKLVDSYLAEIAPDGNLTLGKFIAVADTLPGYARVTDDGLYRAVDIYLKAHPGLSDAERKRLCNLIDFQKLSEEATSHAAQNDRLPVQAVVQVLYIEQIKLRNALCCATPEGPQKVPYPSHQVTNCQVLSGAVTPRDNYSNLRRENRELKLELTRMRMRLNDLEKGHESMKQDLHKSSSKKVMSSITKKIGRLSWFRDRSTFKGSASASECSKSFASKHTPRS